MNRLDPVLSLYFIIICFIVYIYVDFDCISIFTNVFFLPMHYYRYENRQNNLFFPYENILLILITKM